MENLQERLASIFPKPLERGVMATVAEICGVSRPTVSNWFNNPEKVSTISRSHAETICRNFAPGVSPAWLSEGIEPREISAAIHKTESLRPAEIPTLPLSEDVMRLFLDASRDEIDLVEDLVRVVLSRSRRRKKPADKSLLQKLDREHHDGISGEDHDAPGRAHRKRA